MSHLLSYSNGNVGYGLSDDLDEAIEEAVERCEAVQCAATIVHKKTYIVLVDIRYTNGEYTAVKRDPP